MWLLFENTGQKRQRAGAVQDAGALMTIYGQREASWTAVVLYRLPATRPGVSWKNIAENRARQSGRRRIIGLSGWLTDWAANGIFQNKLYKTARCGVLLSMSKKSKVLIPLALVVTLTIVAVVSDPLPRTKKHGTRIQAVNSLGSFSFTLTNNTAMNRLPGSKP